MSVAAAGEIVAADIGGTHARFALARIADGRVVGLGHETVLASPQQPLTTSPTCLLKFAAAAHSSRLFGYFVSSPTPPTTLGYRATAVLGRCSADA